MCVVIDANAFSSIANEEASTHSEFKPLIDWISLGKGKVVYGGTQYGKEIAKNRRFREWLYQLEKKRKTVVINEESVDYTMSFLTNNVGEFKYNDYHVMAIVIVSGCKLVCSLDKGLHKLINVCYQLEVKKLVTKNCPCMENPSRPRIYQNKGHIALLCDQNIAKCCQ